MECLSGERVEELRVRPIPVRGTCAAPLSLRLLALPLDTPPQRLRHAPTAARVPSSYLRGHPPQGAPGRGCHRLAASIGEVMFERLGGRKQREVNEGETQ